MPHWQRVPSHKGAKAQVENIALNLDSANGVGAIEYHDFDIIFGAGLKAKGHGVDISVDSGAHILEINEEGINSLEHLITGASGLGIETIDRKVEVGVSGVA